MTQNQQQKSAQPGTSTELGAQATNLKRTAPESDSLLKDIDKQLKESSRSSSFERKKKSILERCGCF